MHVLSVDTSTSYVIAGVVEVSEDAVRTLAHRTELNPRGHMEVLTPNIVDCLAQAGLSPADLDAVVVGTGPGPFTGLRVGMATGAAFGEALNIPVHGVESHVATACSTGTPDSSPVLVVSDARRREWYWSVVDATTAAIVDGPSVSAPGVLTDRHPDATVLAAREIAAKPELVPASWNVTDEDAHPTPEGLVTAALRRHTLAGLRRPGEPLRALYLRRPDAVVPTRKPVSEALDFSGVDLAEAVGAPVVAALTVEDAEACATIEESVFAGDSPWSEAAFRSEIAAPHTRYIGLFREGTLLGFAGLAMAGPLDDPEFEVHTIALTPDAQGHGWSKLLMDPLIELADRHGGPVFLEVRTDNEPAVGLYRTYGFTVTGTRRGYYQPSGADAFTMHRPAAVQPSMVTDNAVAPASTPRIILGIESSCDETGVGIVELGEHEGQTRVTQISNRVASSMEQHARFGG
ncbi:tRNA (adenosine(37)-N6)-threonylcarbamoyltransferase complex dimerization subunit type 1 TsaB, partial [Corynebacterium variabile]